MVDKSNPYNKVLYIICLLIYFSLPSSQKFWMAHDHTMISFSTSKVICKVTFSFTPYPTFQWYLQNKEVWLNLNMKCWIQQKNHDGLCMRRAINIRCL